MIVSKNTFFTIALLCLTYLAMEVFSFILYYATDGKMFSFSDLANRRAAVLASIQHGKDLTESVRVSLNTVPHPFLGFVYDPDVSTDPLMTRYGFLAERDPIAASRDPNTV